MIKRKNELDFEMDDLLFEQDDFFDENDFGFLDRKKIRNLLVAS